VQELVIVVQGFTPDGMPTAADDGQRLRFGPVRPVRGGWRAGVAALLERPELGRIAVAELVAAQFAPQVAAPRWIATPVHLVAGIDRLHWPADPVVALRGAEASELAAGFNSTLGDGGGDELELRALDDGSLLLGGLRAPDAQTHDPRGPLVPDGVVGMLPSGPGAPALRALMSEIEMWLHGHPVNVARERRGERVISTLWLWGGGAALDPEALATSGSAVGGRAAATAIQGTRVLASDVGVRALAAAAGVRCDDLPPDSSAVLGERDTVRAIAIVDDGAAGRSWIAAAVAALRAGRLAALTLMAADRAVGVTPADRLRIWRPARGWRGALS
jgi:hypothetical protein